MSTQFADHNDPRYEPTARRLAHLHVLSNSRPLALATSEDRSGDFVRSFNPLQSHTRSRWLRTATARLNGIAMPAVELIKVGDVYAVRAGNVLNLLARAFPSSTFHGYNVATEAIALARSEAETTRLSDGATLPPEPRFDLIIALDAIHHQHAPAAVLRRIHQALAPGGIFLMVEHDFSSHLAENLDNPLAPLYYGLSVMHCLTVSLAEGGAGLGIMWGRQAAIQALAEAGFTQVEVLQTPRPQNCMFVCRQA